MQNIIINYIIPFVKFLYRYDNNHRKLHLTNFEFVLFGYNLLTIMLIMSVTSIICNDLWMWVRVGK